MLALALPLGGCAARAHMCTASSECPAQGACVAGRCQIEKATVKPAVDSARRVVLRPLDIGYVASKASPPEGALPSAVVLGKDGGKLFLRFGAAIPADATLVEAYIVLRRSTLVDEDPEPIFLHATRIIDGWSGGSVCWARQPRVAESRAPSTTVAPGGSALVRVDVRDLVRHWARRDPEDHGIAIVAENETPRGTVFALNSLGSPAEANGDPGVTSSHVVDVEPFLELYLR